MCLFIYRFVDSFFSGLTRAIVDGPGYAQYLCRVLLLALNGDAKYRYSTQDKRYTSYDKHSNLSSLNAIYKVATHKAED